MGRITLLIPMVNLISVYITLCLYGAGTVFTYKLKSEKQVRELWGNIFMTSNLSAIVILTFMYVYHSIVSNFLFKGFSLREYELALVISYFYAIYLFYQAYLQSTKKVLTFCINSLAFALLSITSITIFSVVLKYGYVGYFYGSIITACVFYFITIFNSLKNFVLKIDFKLIYKCLCYSLPLLPHVAFGLLLSITDRLFVSHYLGLAYLGFYGVVTQFALFFSVIIGAFTNSFSPFYFEAIQKNNTKELESFIMLSTFVFSAILLAFSSFSYEIISVFTKVQYLNYWYLLPVLCVMYLFNFGYIVFVNTIFYHSSARVNIVTFTGALVNVILNYLWISKYGMVGSAFASVAAAFCSMIVAFLIYRKYSGPKISFFKISGLFFFVVIFIAIICIIQIKVNTPHYNVLTSIAGSITGCLLMYWFFYRHFVSSEYHKKIVYYSGKCLGR